MSTFDWWLWLTTVFPSLLLSVILYTHPNAGPPGTERVVLGAWTVNTWCPLSANTWDALKGGQRLEEGGGLHQPPHNYQITDETAAIFSAKATAEAG